MPKTRRACPEDHVCDKCKQKTFECFIWESLDGAYEDLYYKCTNKECGYNKWVDGIDS